MFRITHFETAEFAKRFMLLKILVSKSTHEHILLLPPSPEIKQQNPCFISVVLDPHCTKREVTPAFGVRKFISAQSEKLHLVYDLP